MKHDSSLTRLRFFLFYGIILVIIGLAKLPPISSENISLRARLFSGERDVVPVPGSEFSVFKPYLPKKGAVSFIMDRGYHPYAPAAEILYTAQSYLAPLVVNIDPIERKALVYCSNGAIAGVWMQRTGYRPEVILGDSRFVAEKVS